MVVRMERMAVNIPRTGPSREKAKELGVFWNKIGR